MNKGLVFLLKECYWLLEKTVEIPWQLRQMRVEVAREIAERGKRGRDKKIA
ncbi:hypothetical protein [Moorella sulfitireducens (nom. illeg.)]|uniref:hypothetical protein n=1 Tax=Neomoorella sulfitireducens TaxID=2972948 RepID=UPI0021ABDE11|nr:hypothetical protein [Moorella sulfitireducens]